MSLETWRVQPDWWRKIRSSCPPWSSRWSWWLRNAPWWDWRQFRCRPDLSRDWKWPSTLPSCFYNFGWLVSCGIMIIFLQKLLNKVISAKIKLIKSSPGWSVINAQVGPRDIIESIGYLFWVIEFAPLLNFYILARICTAASFLLALPPFIQSPLHALILLPIRIPHCSQTFHRFWPFYLVAPRT